MKRKKIVIDWEKFWLDFQTVSYVYQYIEASEKLKLMFLIEKQIKEQETKK